MSITPELLWKVNLLAGGIGLPFLVWLGVVRACLTTPLPERRKDRA